MLLPKELRKWVMAFKIIKENEVRFYLRNMRVRSVEIKAIKQKAENEYILNISYEIPLSYKYENEKIRVFSRDVKVAILEALRNFLEQEKLVVQ